MSGTMSSASSDWLQFYQPTNLSDLPPSTAAPRGWTGEISTNAAATTTNPGGVNRTNPRRRSRASRKTPTTLVNTDTTNFRAMVQQFTGGVGCGGGGDQTAPPFFSGNGSSNQYLGNYNSNNSANFSFGLGPTGSVMAAAPEGGHNFRQPLDGGGGGGGQQYYQGDQHRAFLESLQNYTSSGPPSEDVGPTYMSFK